MNLLIVDDQIKVVQGLLHGVDWKEYSIDHAYGASSVAEALSIFAEHPIDVLLSDIEMPVETGLSLIAWVNQQEMNIRCILLSAHAKFDYAQRSLKLHVFDYILQPAPYEQIAATVQRAVDDLKQEQEKEYLTGLGENFSRSERTIMGSVLQYWLSGHGNDSEFERYAMLGKLPCVGEPCVLGMVQFLRWRSLGEWTPALLEVAIENIAGELFAINGCHLLVTPMRDQHYALLLWGGDQQLVESALEQQLGLFVNVCLKYLFGVVAIYWDGPVAVGELQTLYEKLMRLSADNVSRKSAVFRLNVAPEQERKPSVRMPEISRWAKALCGENPQAVEHEAIAMLDEMMQKKQGDAMTLRIFYQDFLQAFYNALGTDNDFWVGTLSDAAVFKIYCNATNSIEQMKEFIRLAVGYFATRCEPPEQELLQKIDRYIDEHMEEEISRQTLAGHVFLNADYLNRLVRKMTGCALKEYVVQRRLNHAQMLLQTTHLPISLIATKVGYVNAAHFSVAYKKQFGVPPMKARMQASTPF